MSRFKPFLCIFSINVLDQNMVAIQTEIQKISGQKLIDGAVITRPVCSGYILSINYTCLDCKLSFLISFRASYAS